MGVYVAPRILLLLEADPPWRRLTSRNLDPFCTAVEGVSHFLFLLARYAEDRSVSQLELELQAEVDKFLLCSLMLERQKEWLARRLLSTTLFDRYRLLPGLDDEAAARYHLANRLALQFCRTLRRFAHPIDRPRFLREVRRFRNR